MLGTDGTKATLRAFQNYRFRDRNLLLMQAEYRIPLHKNVDATVFYDAGQVAHGVSGLFRDIKRGTGFSLSYMRKGATVGRLDVGYGGGEGVHLFWSFGALGF
jgi:outer membrane translocation and assembly module TamA